MSLTESLNKAMEGRKPFEDHSCKTKLNFKFSDDELKLLRNLTKETGQSMTRIVTDGIIEFAKNKSKIKEYQKFAEKLEKKRRNQQAFDDKKEERYLLYTFKNFVNGITDLLITSYKITGKFNNKLKLHEIKLIEEFYDSADPGLKKLFKDEIKIIKSFKKNNLLESNIELLLKRQVCQNGKPNFYIKQEPARMITDENKTRKNEKDTCKRETTLQVVHEIL